jgi:hypothetical protein
MGAKRSSVLITRKQSTRGRAGLVIVPGSRGNWWGARGQALGVLGYKVNQVAIWQAPRGGGQ